RRAEGDDVPNAIVDDRHHIQMTSILRRKMRDELRAPARNETVVRVDRAEGGEARVDGPQLAAVRESDLVNADVAGVVNVARQKTGVVSSRRIELRGDVGLIAIVPDFAVGAEGETSAADGET